MGYVKGIERISDNETFYHGTCLNAWLNPAWDDNGSLHVTNDSTEAEHYAEGTSKRYNGSPIVMASFSGRSLKDWHRQNVIWGLEPDFNWESSDYKEDNWYDSYKDQGIIVIEGNIAELKYLMSYEIWSKEKERYESITYQEMIDMTEQTDETISEIIQNLKDVFLPEREVIQEAIEKMLKPGTVFWRDVQKVTSQVTFKQFLDRSGVPDSMKKPIYDNIQRFRSLADIFPDKSFVWKALYLGVVYQALSDNSELSKVMNK